jgi:hypothetical protein
MLLRGQVRIPPRFGVWLLFLGWLLLSGLQVQTTLSLVLLLYRGSLYVSATILFLYVFNAPRERLSDRTIVTVLALFWVEVVLGGFLGVLFPNVSFHTPVESLVPASFLHDETVRYFVHPAFAEVMTFLGYPVGRPKVLFAYSNQWGACLAVLTPFALAAVSTLPRGTLTRVLRLLLVLSVIPIVISINRGLWLSLGVGLLYVVVRAALSKNKRAVGAGIGAFVVAAALVFATPLGGLVHDRFANHNNSNETRLSVYKQTISDVEDSPLLGYGSPHKKIDRHQEARVGTQGQAFMVLYSHGIPGLVFFASFFLYVLFRSARAGSPERYWAHVAILIALVEVPYYNYMPTTLHVLMIGIALAWRDIVDPARSSARVAPARRLALAQ